MKKKKIYILGCLVALIWGTIGYKIYRTINKEEEYNAPIIPKRMVADTKVIHYELDLSYDDPFLRGMKKSSDINRVKRSSPVLKKQQPVSPLVNAVVVDWGIVSYIGFLNNTSEKNRVAVIKIRDKDYLLKEGAEADGFTMENITPDSVKVRFDQSAKYIQRQKSK